MSKDAYLKYVKANQKRTDIDVTDPAPVKATIAKLDRYIKTDHPKKDQYAEQKAYFESVLEYMNG